MRARRQVFVLLITGTAIGAGVGTVSSMAGAASPRPQPLVVRAGGRTLQVGSVIGQARRSGDNCEIPDQLGAEIATPEGTAASVEWGFDKDCRLVITKIEPVSNATESSSSAAPDDGVSERPLEVRK